MQKIEQKIDTLLQKMTMKEKVSLCHANSKFTIAEIPRLEIEALTLSDGPHGVREEISPDTWDSLNWDDDYCTYLPVATNLAATWNPALCEKFGKVLGAEARFRKKDVILGPGINIIRNPLCGRNFEYMSEDPCLISKLVVPLIQGIQSCDTAACVKHYALNNQELDRKNVNVEVSKRALFEIYLKGFEAAVCEANVYSVMGAYNRYENQFCCHNKYLVCDILKEQWEFSGVYLSDWAGVHDTEEAVYNGLDLEMGTEKPYNEFYLADAFKKLVEDSPEAVEQLDDKVRRILRLMFRIHKFDSTRKEGAFNAKEHQQVTYDIAAEAMVLLKNENVLPLKKDVQNILVVGDNAIRKHAHGGNSSGIKAFYEVTPLEGIRNRFTNCNIEYIKTTKPSYDFIPVEYLEIIDMGSGSRAFKCEYFDNAMFEGKPFVHYHSVVTEDQNFIASRHTAIVNIPENGTYNFLLKGGKDIEFRIDDELITERCEGNLKYSCFCKKGDRVYVQIENVGYSEQPLELLWSDSDENITLDMLTQKAKESDCVIYCGGINHDYDVEEFDRKDMKLPQIQDIEIPALLKVNKNMVIALIGGSAVEMPWIDEAPAVIWCGYAGMEGGNVLADILQGTICPSGKMPYTLPKRLEDVPAIRYGEYKAGNCRYNEDIYVGYRGFDKDNVEPLFCFGHGLSYAKFKYSNLAVNSKQEGISVSFKLKNESDFKAAETVQIYVGLDHKNIDCPIRELKAFRKIHLEAGEEQDVEIVLTNDDFKVYQESTDTFEILSESCTIEVAASSRDIRLTEKNILICC